MNDVADLMMRFRTEGEDAAVRALNQVDNKIDQVDRSARSAKTGLGGMFATAGGFVLGGVVNAVAGSILNVGSSILMANANAEQSIMSLETVMGSTEKAKAKFAELQAFAAATPFAFPELVSAAINLESFGIKSSDWIGTIGDTASAMGKSVDQVTQAVLDAATGQYERLTELGIKASVEGDKLKIKYFKDGQEIVETVDKNNQQLINSTIQGIWNSKYEGAMEKQSQSFIGRWSTLKDNINMNLQAATGGIFGFASSGIAILNDVFANGFFDTFDGILGPSVTGFLENLVDLGDGIIDAFGSGKGVKELVESLPDSWHAAATEIFNVSDAVGDLWKSIEKGDYAQFFADLGEELKNIAEAGIELGEIVVKGTFKLVSNTAVNLYEWIKGQLFGTAAGDGTGGPSPSGSLSDISVGDVAIKIGQVVVSTIAGWATSAVSTIQTWIDSNQLSGFTQVIQIKEFQPAIDAADEGKWELSVTELLKADPIQITPEIELNISEAISNWIKGNPAEGGGDSFGWSDLWGWVTSAFKYGAMVSNPVGTIANWTSAVIVPDIVAAIRASFKGIFGGLTEGTSEYDVASGTFGKENDSITENIIQMFSDLPGDIVEGVGQLEISIPMPTLPDWLKDFGWITGPIDKLMGYLDRLRGLRAEAKAETDADIYKDAPGGGNWTPTGSETMVAEAIFWEKQQVDLSSSTSSIQAFVDATTVGAAKIKVDLPDMSGIAKQAFGDTGDSATRASSNTANALRNMASIGMQTAGQMRSVASQIVGAFASLPGQLAGLAYNAVNSFAAALWSGVPAITAAATAIANAVDIAVRARLLISSPSRVMDELGGHTVNPFLGHLRRGASEASSLMAGMVAPRLSAGGVYGSASRSGGGGNVYYVFESGSFVGRGAQSEIERMVSDGSAKRVNKGVSRGRLESSY